MSSVTLKDLLEAGAHFGHQTKRWNPKMKRFILCPRNGIYIIDLNKTLSSLDTFLERVKIEVSKGGKVLFVGTKKQVKDSIREQAERCNMPYVTERWLGGMLTNFKTIKQSIVKLEKIEKMEADGTIAALTKREGTTVLKRKDKLLSVLSGIRNVKKIPTVVFVVDSIKEHIALDEANRLGLITAGIVDTNSDPDKIAYPIPANDDAIKSVQLITAAVADAILEAAANSKIAELEEEAAAAEAAAEAAKGEAEEEDEDRPRRRRVVKKAAS